MKRLEGKITLVTGAARGIGAAISQAFIDEGAFVYLIDINDELGIETAKRLGASTEYIHLDVREESRAIALAKSPVEW